jgi:hypothetical protein
MVLVGAQERKPISAVVFVVPLFLFELPVLLASVLATWLMNPPRRLADGLS